jgi:hypothetical protein
MTVHGRCHKQIGVYKPQVSAFASRPKIIGTSSGCNNLVTSCPGAYQKMTFIVRFAVPPPTSTSCRITYKTTRRKRNKWWTWGRQDKELVRQEIVIGITQLLWIIPTLARDILGWSDELHQLLLSESTEKALRYVSPEDRNRFSKRMLLPRSVNRCAVVLKEGLVYAKHPVVLIETIIRASHRHNVVSESKWHIILYECNIYVSVELIFGLRMTIIWAKHEII